MQATYDPTGQADFTEAGPRGIYRLTGKVSAGQLADMMTFALQRALDRGLSEVVLNITSVSGFDSPGPAYRRWLVTRWAHLVGSRLRVVVVARSEHICPNKTGLLVAAEEGLDANIIADCEQEAIAWLDNGSRA